MPTRISFELQELLDELRLAYYRGELTSGRRIPSSRKVADQLHISPTTALALFKLLEHEGVLESRERSGTFLRRAGLERERTAREVALFQLVVRTSKRLKFLGTPFSQYSVLLERCLGGHPRDDFKFGVVMHTELFDNTMAAVRAVYPMLRAVRLAPTADESPDPRDILKGDRTVKCLVASYVFADVALHLGRTFNLPTILITTDLAAWQELVPPLGTKRYLVTRERHSAHDLRCLVVRLLGPEVASRLLIGALEAEHDEDAEFFRELESESPEVIAFKPCEQMVRVRWANHKTVITARFRIADTTIEEMLFHYLFG